MLPVFFVMSMILMISQKWLNIGSCGYDISLQPLDDDEFDRVSS